MDSAASSLDRDLQEIDAAILPNLSLLLDTLLDAAGGARPGIDGLGHARELTLLSLGLVETIRQVEALAALPPAQAPARVRMSA